MFTRWLLTVFPQDVRDGWALLRPDLALWMALATLAALSVPISANVMSGGSGWQALGIITALIGIAGSMASAPLFDAARKRRRPNWRELGQRLLRRAVPFIAAATITVGGALVVSEVAMSAVVLILEGTPLADPFVPIFGILIYVTILVRYCFVPFVVVLRTRAELPPKLIPEGRLRTAVAPLMWPFIASTQLTDGRRWSLAPYIALLYMTRLAGSRIPDGTQIAYAAATFFIGLLGQAILFKYYAQTMQAADSR